MKKRLKIIGRTRGARGFSVIELLVVTVVVGVLATFSVAVIQRSLQALRLESGVGTLSNALMEARFYAIKRNRNSWVAISQASRTIEVRSTDDAGATVVISPAKTLPDGVTVQDTSATTVTFTSLGRNQAGAASNVQISTTSPSNCKRISVSAVGKAAVTTCG